MRAAEAFTALAMIATYVVVKAIGIGTLEAGRAIGRRVQARRRPELAEATT